MSRGRFVFSFLAALSFAQPATQAQKAGVTDDSGMGTLHFRTKLGSFKIIDGSGRCEFTFSGTLLLSGFEGKFDITGNVRKEYEKGTRVIYHGTGKFVGYGHWRGLQWFGRNLDGVWFGKGIIRLSGEFDQDQKTGDYWFDDPNKIMGWPGGTTMDIPVPSITPGYNPNVKIKKKG